MNTFKYRARDRFGNLVSGVVDADSADALFVRLEQKDYVTVKIAPVKTKVKSEKFLEPFKRKKVRFSELHIFTRLLFTLENAGLPLLSSLYSIRDQTLNNAFKEIIGNIAKDIEEGSKFSSALERHPFVFNDLYINMIHSGEISGKLPEVLERLAILGEHEEAVSLRIKSAMRYPIIVVSAIIIAFVILIAFVVPRYETLFSTYETRLPLPTLILLGINYAITKFWWLSIIAISAFIFLFRNFIRTAKGALLWNSFQLKIPLFGPLLLKLFMSRFCRITGTLMASGVPILQILNLSSKSIDNVVVSNAIKDIKESVNAGKGMTEPIKACALFPPIVTQMVAAGEETGKLDMLLIHVADYYDDQIDYTINNMVTLIEPLLIFVMGGAVLLIALGIFMPMWNLMNLFKG